MCGSKISAGARWRDRPDRRQSDCGANFSRAGCCAALVRQEMRRKLFSCCCSCCTSRLPYHLLNHPPTQSLLPFSPSRSKWRLLFRTSTDSHSQNTRRIRRLRMESSTPKSPRTFFFPMDTQTYLMPCLVLSVASTDVSVSPSHPHFTRLRCHRRITPHPCHQSQQPPRMSGPSQERGSPAGL